jgi:two-component system sensor histidine kinase ResE
LDLSKIENGTFVKKKEPLKLSDVILRSFEEMMPTCKERGIILEANAPENLFQIIGDEESLVRVFINIIGNAAKYTPDGGKISVSARNDEYYVIVDISDTGVGIPQDKLPFIFEPFFRAGGKEERHRGSGLGLTYCKKIMDSHGGEIGATSKEGEGTTIMLKFPVPHSGAQKLPEALS